MLRHSWDISPKQAIALQKRLASRVSQKPLAKTVALVAGADCAFIDSRRKVLAAAVLCDARTLEIVGSASAIMPCRFPYVPGLLSFREAPAVIAAVGKLPARPGLLVCDAHGVAHPRRFGLASHVGLWLDIPTIGAAKSRLCGRHRMPGRRRGCRTQLRLDDSVIGAVVRTRDNVKCIYVSVGHRISLDEAVRWTLRLARASRLPEPTRRAHQFVSRLKKVT